MKRKRLALLLAIAMTVTSLDSTAMVASGADFSSEPIVEEEVSTQAEEESQPVAEEEENIEFSDSDEAEIDFSADEATDESAVQETPDEVEVRAKAKADRDAREWLNSTLTGYNSLSPTKSQIIHKPRAREFAVMPVWKYVYRYHSRNYEYYINGQTGKVYGTMPKSTGRILFTGGTMLAGLLLLMQVIQFFVEVF